MKLIRTGAAAILLVFIGLVLGMNISDEKKAISLSVVKGDTEYSMLIEPDEKLGISYCQDGYGHLLGVRLFVTSESSVNSEDVCPPSEDTTEEWLIGYYLIVVEGVIFEPQEPTMEELLRQRSKKETF